MSSKPVNANQLIGEDVQLKQSRDASLRAGVRTALRSVAQDMKGSQLVSPSVLRKTMREICVDALLRKVRAEQLIVMLKESWATTPKVSAIPNDLFRKELFNRVVTATLDEFYRVATQAD